MKKLLTMTALLAAGITAQAQDYAYLNIEKTDGSVASITALGTTITYADGLLRAQNGTEELAISLNEISQMFFSNEKNTTGIDLPTAGGNQLSAQADGIYNLQGQRVAALSGRNALRQGIYIIKENGRTTKTYIR